MLVHAASTPVHASSSPPAPDRKASKSFAEHLPSRTKAADSGHAASAATPTPPVTPTASSSPASASPGTSSASPGSTTPNQSSIQSSLDQSEDQNMQFLELQSQVSDQSETFTTLSNVMKTENDTLKNTAANMAI
jgi:hypothetical protein